MPTTGLSAPRVAISIGMGTRKKRQQGRHQPPSPWPRYRR
jgi:hypothetical protein